jgi:trigger factor
MTTATETPFEIKITDVNPTTKRIAVTAPAAAVAERLDAALAALQAQSALPGFRRGKAPTSLLAKRFGPGLADETRSQIFQTALSEAIEKNGLKPVGDPTLVPGSATENVERGKPFSFAVDVEIVPEFKLPSLEGIPVKKPVIAVEDKHVDDEILRQRYRFGTPNRIEGTFEHLDRMVGRAEVRIDGADGIFFETDEALAVVPAKEDEGKGQLLGLLVENMTDAFLGKKVGDTVTVKTLGPAAHEREEVRGKPLTITFTPKAAERITPAEPKDLAERFGLGTEEIFREQVRHALEQRRDSEQQAAQREQVLEWLDGQVDFPLPEKLSERNLAGMISRQRMDLLSRGVDAEQVEMRLAEMRSSSEASGRRRLKLFLVLARIAEEMGVKVTDAELNGRVSQIAMQQGERPERLFEQFRSSGMLGELMVQIRESKTADRLVAKATVTEIPAEEWNRLVEAKAAAAAPAGAQAGKKSSAKSK